MLALLTASMLTVGLLCSCLGIFEYLLAVTLITKSEIPIIKSGHFSRSYTKLYKVDV